MLTQRRFEVQFIPQQHLHSTEKQKIARMGGSKNKKKTAGETAAPEPVEHSKDSGAGTKRKRNKSQGGKIT